MSVRCSIFDTPCWRTFSRFAIATCVFFIALRRSRSDISSAINSAARASMRRRSSAGSKAIHSSSARPISATLLSQPGQVRIEARIGLADQFLVEPSLLDARLVAGNQQDRAAFGIECESHPPHAAGCIEAKLLHVGVLRALERIDARPLCPNC